MIMTHGLYAQALLTTQYKAACTRPPQYRSSRIAIRLYQNVSVERVFGQEMES